MRRESTLKVTYVYFNVMMLIIRNQIFVHVLVIEHFVIKAMFGKLVLS